MSAQGVDESMINVRYYCYLANERGFTLATLTQCLHPHLAGECSARYWCINGSSTATPTDNVTGQACPEGQYCEKGVPVPDPCPLGTWSGSTGLALSGECQACSGGYYCNGTGLTAPSGPCAAGYYCSSNAVDPMPSDGGTTGKQIFFFFNGCFVAAVGGVDAKVFHLCFFELE